MCPSPILLLFLFLCRSVVCELTGGAVCRDPEEHVVKVAEGCVRHSVECVAQEAIQAAVDAAFDPFR